MSTTMSNNLVSMEKQQQVYPSVQSSTTSESTSPLKKEESLSNTLNESMSCWAFINTGICPRGYRCTWKHVAPDGFVTVEVSYDQDKKPVYYTDDGERLEYCEDFVKTGECLKGDKCTLFHPPKCDSPTESQSDEKEGDKPLSHISTGRSSRASTSTGSMVDIYLNKALENLNKSKINFPTRSPRHEKKTKPKTGIISDNTTIKDNVIVVCENYPNCEGCRLCSNDYDNTTVDVSRSETTRSTHIGTPPRKENICWADMESSEDEEAMFAEYLPKKSNIVYRGSSVKSIFERVSAPVVFQPKTRSHTVSNHRRQYKANFVKIDLKPQSLSVFEIPCSKRETQLFQLISQVVSENTKIFQNPERCRDTCIFCNFRCAGIIDVKTGVCSVVDHYVMCLMGKRTRTCPVGSKNLQGAALNQPYMSYDSLYDFVSTRPPIETLRVPVVDLLIKMLENRQTEITATNSLFE